MKNSIDLFQLIHSLTRSEKRYFKLNAKTGKATGASNYLRLFEAIEKQEVYDENEIRRRFSKTGLARYLPSEKKYLYAQIERALVKFHSASSAEIEIDGLLNAAELLYKKGLFSQALKALNRLHDLVHEHELYAKVFKIARLQSEIIPQVAISADAMETEYARSAANVRRALILLENEHAYQILHARVYHRIRKHGEIIRTPHEISAISWMCEDPLLQDEKKALTRFSRRIYFFIRATYHHMTGNYAEAARFQDKELMEIEADKNFRSLSLIYTARLSNICETALRHMDHSRIRIHLEKIRMAPAEFPLEKARVFYRFHDFSLRYYILTGEFGKACSLARPIQAGLETYRRNIHKSREISLYYHLAYAFWGSGQLTAALAWVQRLLNEKTDLRSDLLCYARLLNCLIFLGKRDYLMLESALKSCQYFFSKYQMASELEHSYFRNLRKFIKGISPEKEKEVFLQWRNEMDRILENSSEQAALEYFQGRAWLTSRIEKISFAEVLKRDIP